MQNFWREADSLSLAAIQLCRCRGLRILVQYISSNSRLLFIICKERAGNIVLRAADTHHLLTNALFIVHRSHVSSASPQAVTSSSCQTKSYPFI